jgi:hypothetical protein
MLQGEAAKLYSVKPTSDIDLSDPELRASWKRVLSGDSSWCLFSYAAPSKTRIAVKAEGRGGPAAFASFFAPDSLTYGAFRARAGASEKLLFICHVGDSVSPMLRGKAAMHRTDMESYLDGTVGALNLGEDEYSAEAIVSRASEVLGAPAEFS